ncbi:EAL domain-containing protein [Kordiimonas aquimaris]|uniref:EAL domain-containing protein n=1 Tax=Kordiimonas aquimaris TaxID=707591 RepID=UPI0021D25D08|nr:EAL domain-containing protein [Kordiimonas aquimaris]
MNNVTQFLLLLSYAVIGMATALFLPLAGVATTTAHLLGVLVFIGTWQIQLSFFGNKKSQIDPIDLHRLEETEKLALSLRDDVAELQDLMAEQSQKGEQKDKKLVSELKVLQEYLVMVMQKETKGGKASKKVTKEPAPVPDLSTQEEEMEDSNTEDQFTAEDLEELGLTPEEAAMAIIDEGTDEVSQAEPERTHESHEAIGETTESVTTDTQTKPSDRPRQATKTKSPDKKHAAPPADEKPSPRTPVTKKKAPIRLIKREDQLLSVVKNSLSENRVDLYLQPIVSLPARKTEHYECFSRVRDEEGRIVLPRQYMKIAETKGLIGTIDNLLLFRLIQLIRRLGRRKPSIKFFCNMSRYSMSDNQFFPQFVDFMASNSEFAERLVFEISQEDYLTLEEDVLERLSTLGRKGFGFSMDMVTDFDQDFVYLSEQHFQFIKADLKDIMASSLEPGDIDEQRTFLERNGIQLIASRIENEEMVITTLDNQIELAQGYLFGEPLAANDMNDDL